MNGWEEKCVLSNWFSSGLAFVPFDFSSLKSLSLIYCSLALFIAGEEDAKFIEKAYINMYATPSLDPDF